MDVSLVLLAAKTFSLVWQRIEEKENHYVIKLIPNDPRWFRNRVISIRSVNEYSQLVYNYP